ncbi:permease [Desulforamulus aeronauticus]|uniref:Permease n=1 Tax=Desulforamulus aeronauticus DSM 10349 TaxID=1121421 RepID=A0A1M6UZQ0_9FIRM|nr:permease [Desulforamulus aeronauticus]SHK73075.1 hypothetical protein SAMN02745123_02922 [Desulforamulus aeronauticus DSM 10349]SHK74668.1 hypothetical protein SAMN02745123_03004 [Desulforamulus aeronauticus DSM 10349]
MLELNNLTQAGKFFLIISGELIALFIGISFLIGLLQEYIPPEKIRAVLTRQKKFVGNIIGAAFGALTPFCSCSTIPMLVGLLNGGAPFGAAMSFLIASPLLNPVILVMFLGLLGLKVTVIYGAITFVAAVLTGAIWERMGLADQYKQVVTRSSCCCCGEGAEETAAATEVSQTFEAKLKRAGEMAWSLFRQTFPYLILGAAIGAFIYGFIPEDWVAKVAGPDNPLAIPAAAIVGVPMYIRVETMLPISTVLLDKGMSMGAILALIIGGAGASIPEVIILSSIFRRKLVAAFVFTIILVAIVAGYLCEILL